MPPISSTQRRSTGSSHTTCWQPASAAACWSRHAPAWFPAPTAGLRRRPALCEPGRRRALSGHSASRTTAMHLTDDGGRLPATLLRRTQGTGAGLEA